MKFGSIPNPVKILILIILLLLAYYTVGTIWIGLAFFAVGIAGILINK